MKWTCNPETGAIFGGDGNLIGVADKSSAVSIVEMHNREMLMTRRPRRNPSEYRADGSYMGECPTVVDETHVWHDETRKFYDQWEQDRKERAEREPLPPLWINETTYRPPSTT